ncbi:DUF1653 domain-containing protein [Streptomyces sp. NPDC002853]
MTDQPTEPTAAVEVWARMLCAADVHVYGGEHPTWQQLGRLSGKLQEDYRKAARWLLPRLTVAQPAAPSAPADRDRIAEVRMIVKRLVAHAKGFQDVLDEPDRDPWARLVRADIDEIGTVLAVLPAGRREFDAQAGLQRLADDLHRGEPGVDAAANRAAEPAVEPGLYRHFKGARYEVAATAVHTESGERLVVYRSGDDWSARPVESFAGEVEFDGKRQARFVRLDGKVVAPADRAAEWQDAAAFVEAMNEGCGQHKPCASCDAREDAAAELRRVAEEAQQAGEAWDVPDARPGTTDYTWQQAAEQPAPVHAVPLPGSNGISSCCGRPPCEFVGERVTRDPALVTCLGRDQAQQAGDRSDVGTQFVQQVDNLDNEALDAAEADMLLDERVAAAKAQQPAEPEVFGPEVVAYRHPTKPRAYLCRQHGDGWAWMTPLTADDLPGGGLCTYGDPADPDDVCGVDVLIPQQQAGEGR